MTNATYLNEAITPGKLIRMCGRLTHLQAADLTASYVGQRLRFRGAISVLTPFMGGVSVSLDVFEEKRRYVAYCVFPGDKDRLRLAELGEYILVDGLLQKVEPDQVICVDCVLLNSLTAEPVIERAAPPQLPVEMIAAFIGNGPGPTKGAGTRPAETGPAESRPALPVPEMQKFAKLYLELWGGEGTERNAFAAVKAAYPGKHVPRERFLPEFRAIRGDKKPGRQRKTQN